jgi:hypothetical protein
MPDFGIYAGDTNKTIYVRLRDSTTGLAKTGLLFNSTGAACYYTLPAAAAVQITLATQTVTGAHTDGGFVEVSGTNAKGLYRLDLSDAAIASGDYTLISIEFDGVIEETIAIPLHTRNVNVTQWLGTAAATPTVAGVPEVDVTHWLGTAAATPTTAGIPEVDVNLWNGVALATTNPLPNATAGAAGGLPTDSTGKTSFNDLSAAQVNTEVDNAIVTYGLDHMVFTSVADTDVADNSIIAKLADSTAVTADFTNYDWTTDSLRAISESATDATAANQTTIINHLTDVKGAGWVAADNLAEIWEDVTGLAGAAMRGTDSAALASVCTETRLSELDAVTAGKMANQVDVIETDTTVLADTRIPDTISLANINAEVDTALDTAISELAQGVPPATPTLREGVMLLYMALRNKLDVTTSGADFLEIHNDAGTVITKKALTDDGSDYSEAECVSGP